MRFPKQNSRIVRGSNTLSEVYVRSAMGIPGSETALEELMSWVLNGLMKEDIVAKIANDLYCGRNSPDELLLNLKRKSPAQIRSSPFRIQNDRQPSVHNDTNLDIELWQFKRQPTSHRYSCLVPWTWHCSPNEVIHQSFQGPLLRHPWMLYTIRKPWRHYRWPWI